MPNYKEIIKRVLQYENLTKQEQLVSVFGISKDDISHRKQRGTIIFHVLDWALRKEVDLNWLILGKTDQKTKGGTQKMAGSGSGSDYLVQYLGDDIRDIKQSMNKLTERCERIESRMKALEKKEGVEYEIRERGQKQTVHEETGP